METTINISKFWTRIWALIIDGIIIGIFGYLLGLTMQDFLVSIGNYGLLFGLAITLGYETICNSKLTDGQTIGKRLMNIQVVDIEGNTLGLDKSLIRSLILSTPFLTLNLVIPEFGDIAILNISKTILLTTMIIGIIVVYIFNKQTRQSLHDLIIGSYVVTIKRSDEPITLPTLTKTPFYIFVGLAIVFACLAIYTTNLENPELKNVLEVHKKVLNVNGVLNASVIEKTTTDTNDSTTRVYETTIWVVHLPEDSLQNNVIVQEVAKTILTNASNIDRFDKIKIALTREFNIGIASQKFTMTISKSPNNWREVLK